jgi:hypothetical protein
MLGGLGRTSAAISGMMMMAPMINVWTMIDSGTVYHFWLPTLIDGSTMSPNMSRGTVSPRTPSLCAAAFLLEVFQIARHKGADYSQSKN